MICSEIHARDFARRLDRDGIWLSVGSMCFHLRAEEPSVARGLHLLYRDYPVAIANPGFADFHIRVRAPRNVRRWLSPQIVFDLDGLRPFDSFPIAQAHPMVEWGMNWCVSSSTMHLLVVHAAVLERGGRALVMPAPPGSGKSTLCAALVGHGWRLLSDELALVDLVTGRLHPFPRPVSLKNESIAVIRDFLRDAVVTAPVRDTLKGDIAYLRPPTGSVERAGESATPGWIVFPRYRPGGEGNFERVPKADAFKEVAEQAFNYYVLGQYGFDAVASLIDGSDCSRFEYESLPAAVAAFDALATRTSG